jgi:hypothetical protein
MPAVMRLNLLLWSSNGIHVPDISANTTAASLLLQCPSPPPQDYFCFMFDCEWELFSSPEGATHHYFTDHSKYAWYCWVRVEAYQNPTRKP